MKMMSRFMPEKDVAEILGLSPRTLQKMRVEGGGPEFHKFGHAVRYELAEIEAWVESRRRRSTSDNGDNGEVANDVR